MELVERHLPCFVVKAKCPQDMPKDFYRLRIPIGEKFMQVQKARTWRALVGWIVLIASSIASLDA